MISRALVTGGAGFIGSHIVDSLLADGVSVVVVDDCTTGDPARVAAEADLAVVSIVHRPEFDEVVDRFAPEAIFHLGAQSSVTVSVTDPARDCAVNVQGTLNVLEAANRHRAPLVFTSTGGALYGNEAPIPTPEDRLPAPLAPYGASKWAGEAYIATWAAAHGIPHAICRLGNVYGPRQSPHGEAGVVSIFTHRLHSGQAPKLFGHGKPTRDYVYVGDVVAALLAAAGKAGTFNVATGVATDVMRVWSELKKVAGSDMEPELAELRPGELQNSCLDASLAARELGWRAQVGIEEGLRRTYQALVEEFERAE